MRPTVKLRLLKVVVPEAVKPQLSPLWNTASVSIRLTDLEDLIPVIGVKIDALFALNNDFTTSGSDCCSV
jgi:hypothetical protein